MNQILYVEKSKNSNSLSTEATVKIFVISIIIFAIIFIGKGVYGIVNSKKNDKVLEPSITINELEEELQIIINHEKAIDKIIYSWNNGKQETIQGRGRTNIVETIEFPTGNNTLYLKIIDSNKKETSYTKEYYRDDKDTIKPEIELVVEGSRVRVVAKDERKLSYIKYNWNDEDETIVEVREDSPKQIEERVSILKGENKLTIVAVDEAGNETVKEQIYKGAKKPTIEVTQTNDELLIKVSDEENIQKIEINLNGNSYSTDHENTGEPLNMKEAELNQKLEAGENNIVITAYSVNGLSEQVSRTITI